MDSVSSTLSSESSVSFSESDTDAESIHSSVLFRLAHSLPDDIATAAAEGDLTVVRRWLEARRSLTDPTLMEPSDLGAQQFHPQWNADELKTIKELVAGVRREGSWLAFRRAEQKASFRLWWLVARGRATTADPLLGRVAGLPNELRSKVLGYWCLAE